MHEGRTVVEEILMGFQEVWVFENEIYTAVSDSCPDADRETAISMSVGVILQLLEQGLVYPVFWEDDPWSRKPDPIESWDGDPWIVAREICDRWKTKMDVLGPPDIVWFGPTLAGFNRGIEVLRREGRRL